ncbi:MAG: AAA family ATPase [Cyanobacteria bacterium J06633_2]
MPTLFIFGGLPGTGKTSLARGLAQMKGAFFLRIDTIEQALRDLCDLQVEGEGYHLAYRIAADNLKLGLNVVADSCNPIELTRREWQSVAIANTADFVNIEVICTNADEHRRRIESRSSDIAGLQLPDWQSVVNREYHEWSDGQIIIDTAGKSIDQALVSLLRVLPNT